MASQKVKKILKILSDGQCHSGEALGEKLDVTRAAIWKLIHQLKEWQIEVEAKTNQGYCIPGGMELLDAKKIAAAGIPPRDGRDPLPRMAELKIEIFDELTSTNTYLIERVRAGQKDVRVCLAEYQSQGRGRFGRPWVSAYGKNIYCSLLWTFTCDLSHLAGLSLVVAIAVVRALKTYGVAEGLSLKWPNDVLWHGKKLAGILIELHGESHHMCDAVIGIGINGEMSEALKKTAKKALADIHEITGKRFERNRFVALLLTELTAVLTTFEKEGLKPFVKEWQKWDAAMNQPVRILLGDKTILGIYRGIDPQRGELLLEDAHGKIQHYSGGEVSLRPLQ